MIKAEYIWIDGQQPTAKLRSKTKILKKPIKKLSDIPKWGFDGSSTDQAKTKNSDLMLKPVSHIDDPVRGGNNDILVLCEVLNFDNGLSHQSNTRAILAKVSEQYKKSKSLFGIEQEYTLYNRDGKHPLGWPEDGSHPAHQGRYYCGVGSDEVYGRELVEAHLEACLKADIKISGINAEVMPAQWEFQVGPLDALKVSDQLWLARWLLYRLGEEFDISVKLDPKPITKGNWNGAGAHVNFSTTNMRNGPTDSKIIALESAYTKLEAYHNQHIKVYGADNDKRLTGKHETCLISDFKVGVGDRGASIRLPSTDKSGQLYLEDRRPAANMDPYQVCTALIETVCGQGFDSQVFKCK